MATNAFECPICLEFYSAEPTTDYFVTTNCGHTFHFQCILKIVKAGNQLFNCPLCCSQNHLAETLTRNYNIDVVSRSDKNTFSHQFKFVILGKFKAGKSSILRRFALNEFSEKYTITKDVDYIAKSVQIGNQNINLHLWDTAGQEEYRSIVSSYVRNAYGIIFVYDITDMSTFRAIEDWILFAKDNGPQRTKRILVGNKFDLALERQVPTNVAQKFATKNGYSFLECSAKVGFNIPAIFRTLTTEILNDPQVLDSSDILSTFQTNVVNQKSKNKPNSTCC